MTDDKDRAQKFLIRAKLEPGSRFRHYKGGEYEIITGAVKEDTLELLVVYRSLEKGYVWVRTLANWREEVDSDGKRVQRFAPL